MIHAICWRAILLIRQSDTDSRQLQMLMSLERKHYQRKMYHIFSVPLLLSKTRKLCYSKDDRAMRAI